MSVPKPAKRPLFTKRSAYGGAVLFVMTLAVLVLLHTSKDKVAGFHRQGEWVTYTGGGGAFTLELPATWPQHKSALGTATQVVAIRSSDTLIGVVGQSLQGQVPAGAPMNVWRSIADDAHEGGRMLFAQLADHVRESAPQYHATGWALYRMTEANGTQRKSFREIPKWGRRVTMVTPKTLCIVECMTRESHKGEMAPIFKHVIESLKPTG